MRPVSEKILIDVPRERVFDILCDLSIRPAFIDHFVDEYRLQRVEPVGPGAAARFRMGKLWMDTTIELADRPHIVRETGRGGRVNRLGVFTVWELAEGPSDLSTELTLTFWIEPNTTFDRLHEKLRRHRPMRRGWKRALERLRALAEDGDAPQRVGVAGEDRLPEFVR